MTQAHRPHNRERAEPCELPERIEARTRAQTRQNGQKRSCTSSLGFARKPSVAVAGSTQAQRRPFAPLRQARAARRPKRNRHRPHTPQGLDRPAAVASPQNGERESLAGTITGPDQGAARGCNRGGGRSGTGARSRPGPGKQARDREDRGQQAQAASRWPARKARRWKAAAGNWRQICDEPRDSRALARRRWASSSPTEPAQWPASWYGHRAWPGTVPGQG